MDIQQLKLHIHNENKIEQILTDLGCHSIKDKGGFISCGNPDGDNKSSVIIYKCELLNVNNYTRKITSNESNEVSDLLTLTTFYKKQSNPKHKLKDTIIYLHKLLNLPLDKNYKKKEEVKLEYDPLEIFRKVKRKVKISRNEELEIHDESIFHDIIPLPHINLIREGILPHTCEEFNVGYSLKHKRHVFPHRYWAGDKNSYLGMVGRTSISEWEMLGIPKYLSLNGYNFQKGLNLYGLNENYEHIQKAGKVVIVEGEKSVLKRHSRGDKTCVAVSCHTLTQTQIRILISLEVEIVVCWDKDVSLQEIKDTCKHFKNIRPVYFIYDQYNVLKDKESPCDLPDSEYRKMFQQRIKY